VTEHVSGDKSFNTYADTSGGTVQQFGGGFTISYVGDLPQPGTADLYLTGNPSIVWESSYGGQLDAPYTALAGHDRTEFWNQYPLHPQPFQQLLPSRLASSLPAVPSVYVAGGRLWLDLPTSSDNTPGHYGQQGIPGAYRITRNGVVIAHGNAGPPGSVRFGPGRPLVGFQLNVTNPSDPLSSMTSTAWTWRAKPQQGARVPNTWFCPTTVPYPTASSRNCAVQPLMTLSYQVKNLDVNEVAPSGAQQVDVAVGHQPLAPATPIKSVTASVSYDGGSTWHPATVAAVGVDQYQLTFTAPTGADVTLQIKTTDAAGGSISETIINGYATS
jgi:hypothetical protein